MLHGRSHSIAILSDFDIQHDIEQASRCGANVLITGADAHTRRSVAEQIHQQSDRRDVPLTIVAAGQRRHAAGRSPSTTIFIEEVGRLSSKEQKELLTFLESSGTPDDTRCRIIAASSDRLYGRVLDGHFHAALYYRLNVIHIALPRADRM